MSRRTVLFLGSAVAAIVAAATVAAWPSAFVGAQPDVQVRAYMPLVLKSFGGSLPRPPTVVPPTPTPAPTNTRGPTATTTNTRPPTATRTPTATPTPTGPAWLQYVNYHRSLAKLPALTKNDVWGAGGQKHSKYMVKNDVGGHTEDPRKPYYSQEGHDAAQNGNVAAYSAPNVPAEWAIDGWMTAPFHQLQIINPRLAISGFGDYSEGQGLFAPNQAFDIQYGAVLDVLRGRVEDLPASVRFPVHYPEQDQAIPNLLYDGGESPNPLAYCSGYKEPTGPPLLLLLGGDAAPKVSKTSFKDERGTELPHCWFDETKVKSPEAAFLVLARDHAVVVMPRSRLTANARYTLTITSGGTAYSWSFKAGPERGQPLPPVWQSEMVEPGLAGQ